MQFANFHCVKQHHVGYFPPRFRLKPHVYGKHGSCIKCRSDGSAEADRIDGTEMEAFETSSGVVAPLPVEQAQVDYFGESNLGNLHFMERTTPGPRATPRIDLADVDKVLLTPFKELKAATRDLISQLSASTWTTPVRGQHAVGNTAPNLSSVALSTLPTMDANHVIWQFGHLIKFDALCVVEGTDTPVVIVYDEIAWEGKAYEYSLRWLREQGLPVDGLEFDPTMVIRGLILDKELGNLVKVDRFGYVKRAMHGTRMMSWGEIHGTYGRELVNLKNEARYMFLNTLFSVSEAVLFCQLVDRLDDGEIGPEVVGHSYPALYKLVSKALFKAHVEGKLKAEIIQEPEKYVELDPEMAQTLLDMKQAGKQLLLITNSDYHYTQKLMSFAYNRFLPAGTSWRDLFDLVIVNARKPDFFNHNMSLYEIATEDGLMRPAYTITPGGVYCGGSARQVEDALGVNGDAILYVGDHIYTDNALAKLNFRWRTALIIRELEHEIEALARGRPHRQQLKEAMNKKEMIGDVFNQLRLARQRVCFQPLEAGNACEIEQGETLSEILAQLLAVLEALDRMIGPMLERDGEHFNERWGYLSRAGLNDKSQLTRQIEKYADIYTSRVSNFLRYTPFMYFRSPSQSLAHDRELTEYYLRTYGKAEAGPDGHTAGRTDSHVDGYAAGVLQDAGRNYTHNGSSAGFSSEGSNAAASSPDKPGMEHEGAEQVRGSRPAPVPAAQLAAVAALENMAAKGGLDDVLSDARSLPRLE